MVKMYYQCKASLFKWVVKNNSWKNSYPLSPRNIISEEADYKIY